MNKAQMELTFAKGMVLESEARGGTVSATRRMPRAHWWFHQMRVAVDRAWHGAAAGRPEQRYLTLAVSGRMI